MRLTFWLAALLPILPYALATNPVQRLRSTRPRVFADSQQRREAIEKRNTNFFTPAFSNPKAATFHVNSSTLPLITFPLQDSWAGRLPITNAMNEERQLFFWYWPSSKSTESDTLTIWLNGGPGCSSLGGFLQENGPISFQPGMTAPQANPYAWTNASDVVWIEQPVGTGFTLGTPDIHNESELSDEFYGFLQQFYTVFPELAAKKLFITGESYAGFYIPYIATRIVDASAAEKAALHLDLQGLLINDGVYSSFITSEEAPTANFSTHFQSVLGFSNSQITSLQRSSRTCGYETMLRQTQYPPKGKIDLPNGNRDSVSSKCDLFDTFLNLGKCSIISIPASTSTASPTCVPHRKTPCPDTIPLTSPFVYQQQRSDVQTALHVPGFGTWVDCSDINVFVNGNDDSAYTETLFPHLLATLPRGVTLWHGLVDAILFNLGDRITIQNMTWGGVQGFRAPPSTPLIVGGAQKGIFHSERKLTYIEVDNAGHMIETDQPQTALHVFQSILGQTTL
ncbi:hypothetical protein EW146_g3885 [Bondarzewia mesenterica]|uniref:Carboxypeptidase n=1 Tax=Bondarzewia mesenterica TaxID=1095465 RepID=A0A4S4LW61_9AGAM|nr:hypothetical protein EW146_g3885 [Bondarzewia mesenterica]